MLIEEVERNVEAGCNREIVLLMEWDISDKSSLSFEELRWFLGIIPDQFYGRNEAWELIKKKAETFSQLQWIWKQLDEESLEKSRIWKLMIEKVKQANS